MIRGLDHVAIAVRDFDAAVDGYRRLLGREPDFAPRDGASRAWFRFPNMALEVVSPSGEGPAGDRVRAQLEAAGEGVWLAAFAVEDVAAASRLLSRRGVAVEPEVQAELRAIETKRPVGIGGVDDDVVEPGDRRRRVADRRR